MTCVAVIITLLIAACSSPKPEITIAPPTASATPSASSYDISANNPEGYDEWAISGSSVPEPTMQRQADQFGLPGIFVGKGGYAKAPFKGIVAFEMYCVVTFMDVRSDVATLVILSRYNTDLSIAEFAVKANEMKERIDSYRPMCRGQAPVPATKTPKTVKTA